MMNVKVIYDKSMDDINMEYDSKCSKIWDIKKFNLYKYGLFMYLFIWLGYFMYNFCQYSFKFYIKTFKLSRELEPILISLISLILFIILSYRFIKQLNIIDDIENWYSNELYNLSLVNKLKNIENFTDICVNNEEISINYLTGVVSCSIILSKECFSLGEMSQNDILVVDFKSNQVYTQGVNNEKV